MIPSSDSLFIKDMIAMDVMFEQIRAWILGYNRELTKKEIIDFMRKIQGKANWIESKTKDAGWTYFGVDRP